MIKSMHLQCTLPPGVLWSFHDENDSVEMLNVSKLAVQFSVDCLYHIGDWIFVRGHLTPIFMSLHDICAHHNPDHVMICRVYIFRKMKRVQAVVTSFPYIRTQGDVIGPTYLPTNRHIFNLFSHALINMLQITEIVTT